MLPMLGGLGLKQTTTLSLIPWSPFPGSANRSAQCTVMRKCSNLSLDLLKGYIKSSKVLGV